MRIKNVDFLAPLLEAQQVGSLVVFAGAGVSMPPPSNYPNFDSLAEQAVGGVVVREQYGEQRDCSTMGCLAAKSRVAGACKRAEVPFFGTKF
jgi:hypothetical protein